MHYNTTHCNPLQYITIHCSTLQYITVHYNTLQYTTLHYGTSHCLALHKSAVHCITLRCITLHYITLHYITLHYITLHYITLHYTTLHTTHTMHTCIPTQDQHMQTRTTSAFWKRLTLNGVFVEMHALHIPTGLSGSLKGQDSWQGIEKMNVLLFKTPERLIRFRDQLKRWAPHAPPARALSSASLRPGSLSVEAHQIHQSTRVMPGKGISLLHQKSLNVELPVEVMLQK